MAVLYIAWIPIFSSLKSFNRYGKYKPIFSDIRTNRSQYLF